ncbi:MAG: hypoxanthine phosphoribosyltransferase [Candidatus Aureabacteria bacterium]|nr:hypoxanthine phosphoribosyltransferase [Candidatus Auribacterota bacterium]
MLKQEEYKIGKTLISSKEIKKRVKEIAAEINKAYKGKELCALVLLKGSFIFAADLLRSFKVDSYIDFMKVESYGASMTSRKLVWHFKITDDVKGKHLLVIDDMCDSGKTLSNAVKYLKTLKPADIKVCVLLKKIRKRNKKNLVKLDYVGFKIPDTFVIGYGLDFAGKYRNLPFIAKMVKK